MFIENKDVRLNVQEDGNPGGRPVVFANSLGTDLHLWDPIMDLLPKGPRYIRWDKRGHGRSDAPDAPYTMGQLVSDAEAVCDALEVRDCVFVGLSVGGMIAQGLAVKRLDIVRALVLSNTGAKIGTRALWEERIAAVLLKGMEPLADSILERWFTKDFRASGAADIWRERLAAQNAQGYAGVCAAIAGTDYISATSGLRLPTLAIAGSDDRATPADLVRETAGLIPGSQVQVLRRSGHLSCVDQPDSYAQTLGGFLTRTGTV